jgi:hypothetical protein
MPKFHNNAVATERRVTYTCRGMSPSGLRQVGNLQ